VSECLTIHREGNTKHENMLCDCETERERRPQHRSGQGPGAAAVGLWETESLTPSAPGPRQAGGAGKGWRNGRGRGHCRRRPPTGLPWKHWWKSSRWTTGSGGWGARPHAGHAQEEEGLSPELHFLFAAVGRVDVHGL
jgi:hypothetical protein